MVRALKMPDDNKDALTSHASNNLANCLFDMGRFEDSSAKFLEAKTLRIKCYGPGNAMVAASSVGLSKAFRKLNRLEEAQALAEEAIEIDKVQLRQNHPDSADAYQALGMVLLARGDPQKAEPPLKTASEMMHSAQNPIPLDAAEKDGALGECLLKLGHPEIAEPLLTSSFETVRRIRGDSSRKTSEAAKRLIDLYDQTNQKDKAGELRVLVYRAAPAK
jgi:tetratricopeptide (TPR) repeat protein